MTVVAAALFTGCTSGPAEGEARGWEVERAYGEDPVAVRLRVDRLRITTAQVVRVEVEVDAPEGVAVRLPDPEQFADSGFQVAPRTEPPALVDDGRTRHLRRFRLEPFLAGDYPIPALAVGWLAPGGEPAGLSTGALTVQVSSVLGDAAVAAVAVGKWVDRHEAVMEPDREFVGRVRLVLHPGDGVADEHPHRRRDLPRVDSDVGLATAVPAGPLPDLAEHVPMQVPQIAVVEQDRQRWGSSQQGKCDVALLRGEQVASAGDVGGDQPDAIILGQFRVAIAERE